MCGIAGIVNFNKNQVSIHEIKLMTDAIVHRGPDGEGQWVSPKLNAGLGHRRLSIIDLSENGKQPMHFADGRYTITFNGEIYNYIELRETLYKKGYKFKSNSDTEVLLALYDLKKEKCLSDLDGMFSFAIWDEKEQNLFCARDRFGEKPFHYCIDDNQFTFASEIKQFWSYGIKREVSESRLKQYFENGEIEDESNLTNTFYSNIKRLDAACYLTINPTGKLSIKKYWEIDLHNNYSGELKNASEHFLHLFTDSIRLRLRSDVPIGSSLSGGLDSSSIVMLIDQLKENSQKQSTFSARFKNFNKDEGFYIEEVKKACKNNLDVKYIWPDKDYFAQAIEKVSYHQDEPFGSASIVAQYAVMELAKNNNITVLLDGQGADEYLGGYLPYYNLYLNQLFYNKRKSYRNEVRNFNSLHSPAIKHYSLEDKETTQMKIGRLKRILLNQDMPITNDSLQKKLLLDTTQMGLKTLLRYSDRNSMAHSREVRLPFLSQKLVEFVFSLPDDFKLKEGWTKFILRKSMDEILPNSICWRVDKIGYEPPQNDWMNSEFIKEDLEKARNKFKELISFSTSATDQLDWKLLMANTYFK